MEMVADLFYDKRKTTVDQWQGAAEAAQQHRRIYLAIRSRDVEKARTEMGRHLTWAQKDQEADRKR
jgi:DNA-binding FadR family transcriptional regulator